jgi:MoaA/NifB/PqqE/SkfB family radical SAM enzyme
MSNNFVSLQELPKIPLWEDLRRTRGLLEVSLEITARCNNNCRHCYINLPANDSKARQQELSLREIESTVDQGVSLVVLGQRRGASGAQ